VTIVVRATLLLGRWVGRTASLADLDNVVCVDGRRVEDIDTASLDELGDGGDGVGVVGVVVRGGGIVLRVGWSVF
jgi:hypothetical protein